MFPCLAKFLEHSTLNSVQSTTHLIFFMALKTLGRNLLRCALSGKINSCMSLNVTYICCENFSHIRLIDAPFRSAKQSCKGFESKSSL